MMRQSLWIVVVLVVHAFAGVAYGSSAIMKDDGGGGHTVTTVPIYEDDANNRIGIGTTAPSDRLHVAGGNLRLSYSNKALRLFPNYAGADTHALLDTLGASMQLRLAATGNTGLTIDTDGDVGIGTTSPGASYKLDVHGAGYYWGDLTIAGGGIRDGAGTARLYFDTGAITQVADSDGTLRLVINRDGATHLNEDDGGAAITIWTDGNVGINNTVPTFRLDVAGTGRFTNDLTLDAGLVVDTTTLVVDEINNRVGIGTATPDQKLEILGPTTGATYLTIGESTTKEAQIGWDGSNEVMMMITNSHAYPIKIGNNWMYFETGGDVGIGNAAPSYKLDVNGTGHFTGKLYLSGELKVASDLVAEGCAVVADIGCLAGGWEFWVSGDQYVTSVMSAGTVVDRTPYPVDLATAYAAVVSMQRLPDGEYDPDDPSSQLDHSALHPFVAFNRLPDDQVDLGNTGRNLSAAVSAQNEVIKDLITRLADLEAELATLAPQQTQPQ